MLQLKTVWHDEATRIAMSPLEFMPQRLAVLEGESTIIVATPERLAIEKIFTHLGLGPQPLPKAPARELGPHHAG